MKRWITGLPSALRGSLWLVRAGGLRERSREAEARLDLLEARLIELGDRLGELGDQLARADAREERVGGLIQGQFAQAVATMVGALDERAGRLGGQLDHRMDRQAGLALDYAHGLNVRLDRLIDRFEATSALFRSRAMVRGHTMLLDPTDSIVSPMLLRDGYFELLETELVEREVRRGDVVLDVGANIGYYTLIFARLVGDEGKVYAFEPDPHNFELLKKNVRVNGYRNVVLVNKALSDRSGSLKLYLCPDNKGDHRIYESEDARDCVEIQATTADDYFGDDPVRVDFIKMDIQGSEGLALRGMASTLARNPSVRMVSEFWPAGLRRSGVAAEEYLRSLQGLGFEISEVDEVRDLVAPRTMAELLGAYPADREAFTNLFCTRMA